MENSQIIASVLNGSATPCSKLLDLVELGAILRREAEDAIQRHYGGRVRSVEEGARIERADIYARDC